MGKGGREHSRAPLALSIASATGPPDCGAHPPPAGDVAGRPVPKWTEERLRRELATFLAGRRYWPKQIEFRNAGRGDLLWPIQRFGGAARWAGEFGLRFTPRRKPAPRWNEERIRAALTPFLAGRSAWPTEQEFEEAGLGGLRRALYQVRGVDAWIDEFGLPRRSEANRWTDERIRSELTAYLADKREWPRQKEFKAHGQWNLLKAVYANGGARKWAAEFGLTVRLPVHRR